MNFLERIGLKGPLRKLTPEQRKFYNRERLRLDGERVNALRRARREKRIEIIREQKRQYYLRNKAKILAECKVYRDANLEKRYAAQKAWRDKNKEVLRLRKKEEYLRNRTKYREAGKKWYKDNPNWGKEYRQKNKDKIREWSRKYHRELRAKDPAHRATASMRSRVWALLKKAGQKKIHSIGLTKDALKAHLEPLFLPGMTWDNYGSEWHVDHHIPCSAFDMTNPEHLKFCFSLSNLRPLWGADNIRKHDTIPEDAIIPFPIKNTA